MLLYLLTFAVAFVLTYVATPLVSALAVKLNALDLPGKRKVHLLPIPRLGGVAIYLGFVGAVFLALLLAHYFDMVIAVRPLIGIFLASTIMLLVGIVDDLRGVRATVKLIFQIIAAVVLVYFGLEINFVSNPFNGILPLGLFAIPLTLLWVVGLTNAMNLIDGLDGLASGVTAISAITLFFVALRTHQIGAAILLITLFGVTLAFLRFNFFPATIFLGDSGALFLGFILASASIVGVLKTTLVVALVVPILILGVPIFDTIWAFGRRLKEGQHPFAADDKHIHHLLLRAGFNQREAVLAIYSACFILSFIALVMALQK